MLAQNHKKITYLVSLLVCFSLLLGACSTATSTPTATEVPPAAEPEAVAQVLSPISQADLTTGSWQWISGREAQGDMPYVVPDPENYTVTFNNDNTLNIKADCNTVLGTYELSGEKLTITLGASTLAACPPGSSSDKFLAQISTASSVGTGFGSLVIGLAASGGEMYFQQVPAAVTPPLDANLTPITQEALIDTLWQWIYLKETSPSSEVGVGDPENYDLVFRADGTYSAKADCNQLAGTYELSGSNLTINPGISSLAACPDDSKYDLYMSLLARVTGVGELDGLLVLLLKDNPASMSFVNAGPAPVLTVPQTVQGDPAVVLGRPSGVENFDNENNWTTFDGDCFTSQISGGQFVMTAKGVPQFSCWEVSWPKLDNFYLETSQIMPQTCDPQDRFGLLFRAPDTNRGYLYGYSCAGDYSLTIWDGQTATTLVEPTRNDAILSQPGNMNRMGLLVFNGDISLYANGVLLTSLTDYTFMDAGKVGYFVRAATENPFTVSYDQAQIWALEDEFLLPSIVQPVPPVDLPSPPTGVATGEARVNVNVRTGPSMLFPIIGTALQGETGEILGISPDGFWYAVRVPENRRGTDVGWVSAQFVNLTNTTGQALPVATPPLLPLTINFPLPSGTAPQVVMREPATIRSGPTLEFPVMGVAPTGARAQVIGESEDREWWAIRVPNTLSSDGMAWVNKVFTSSSNISGIPVLPNPTLPRDINSESPGSGAPSLMAIDPINVRVGPGGEYEVLGRLAPGSVLPIIGISPDGEHYIVNVPVSIHRSGQGWVAARLVNARNVSNLPVIQPPPLP